MIGEVTFLYPDRVHLIWLALAFGSLLAWLDLRGRGALGRFLSASMQSRLVERPTLGRSVARAVLLVIALAAGVLALMRPQTKGATETISAGRISADIVVALDVSRSMLAEDAVPNRLARAKAEISDLASELAGQRLGLVAYAGRASVMCPLTPDYGFFRMVLRGVDTNSISRGGTRIGDAIRESLDAFTPGAPAKMILLITDGEDHDSYPLDAAKAAVEAGVKIVAIGFGSEQGSEITITDKQTGAKSVLHDQSGRVVKSRLDGELLRKIALETEGAYVPAGVAALDLKSIVSEHIQPLVQAQAETAVRVVPREEYTWFVMTSLLSLLAAVWLGSTTGKRRVS